MTMLALLHKHRADLDPREVGGAPTIEWTGRHTPELESDLAAVGYGPGNIYPGKFRSDNPGHPDFGQMCIGFVTFGIRPIEI